MDWILKAKAKAKKAAFLHGDPLDEPFFKTFPKVPPHMPPVSLKEALAMKHKWGLAADVGDTMSMGLMKFSDDLEFNKTPKKTLTLQEYLKAMPTLQFLAADAPSPMSILVSNSYVDEQINKIKLSLEAKFGPISWV